MKFCPKCGAGNDEPFAFCSACGSRIEPISASGPDAASAASSPALGNQRNDPTSSVKRKRGLDGYFSFKGRARRGEFWGFVIAVFFIWLALSLLCRASAYFSAQSSPIAQREQNWTFQAPAVVATGLMILLAIPSCAVLTRRFHDVNLPTWLAVVSFAIAIVCGGLAMKFAQSARLASIDKIVGDLELTDESRALFTDIAKNANLINPEAERRYKIMSGGFGLLCFAALAFNAIVGFIPGTPGPNGYGALRAR